MIDYDQLHRTSLLFSYTKIVNKYLKAYPEIRQIINDKAFELHRSNVEKYYKAKCSDVLGFVPDHERHNILGQKPIKPSYQDLYIAIHDYRIEMCKILKLPVDTSIPTLIKKLKQRLNKHGK